MKTAKTLFCAFLLLGMIGAANAEQVINQYSSEYSGSGMARYGNSSTVVHCEAYDYMYNTDGTGLVTITPGVTGTQSIQFNWYQHSSNSSAVECIVNHVGGQSTIIVNQQQLASQGAVTNLPTGALPAGANGFMGSGWYTLGTFELDSSSTVVIRDQGGDNGFNFDVLRVGEGIILDTNSANFVYSAGWGGPYSVNDNPYESWNGYACPKSSTPTFTVTPGETGRHELFASWIVNSAHAGQVFYEVDLDGIEDSGDEVTVWGNQMYNAEVQAVANNTWSGWLSLGEFDITEDTVIRTTAGDGGSYLSAADFKIVAIPEPATLCLLAAGGLVAGVRRKR